MESSISAVTFDLWDTIIVDESDEPKRVAKGLLSKYLTRRELVWKFLEKHEPIARELLMCPMLLLMLLFAKCGTGRVLPGLQTNDLR